MSDNITHCSAFSEDTVFGTIIDSFKFRWIDSCIAKPEYEPEDMLKTVLHALASSENKETPFLIILVQLVWDDTSWNSASTRGHNTMSTLIRIPSSHMRYVPARRQSDDKPAALLPAKWPVELVLVSN